MRAIDSDNETDFDCFKLTLEKEQRCQHFGQRARQRVADAAASSSISLGWHQHDMTKYFGNFIPEKVNVIPPADLEICKTGALQVIL